MFSSNLAHFLEKEKTLHTLPIAFSFIIYIIIGWCLSKLSPMYIKVFFSCIKNKLPQHAYPILCLLGFVLIMICWNFSRSSRNFGEDLEDPRSDRIYSSGNRGVKKGPGPWGSRDEEFLVPSLLVPLVGQKTRSLHEILTRLVITENAWKGLFSNNQPCQYFM